MELATYQALAARTMRPDEKRTDGQPRYGRDSALHFALGLCGETGELAGHFLDDPDDPGIVKELGDVCWYIAMGCTLFEHELAAIECASRRVRRPQVDPYNRHAVLLSINAAAAQVSEYIKKSAFFGHEIDLVEIAHRLSVVWWHIPHLVRIFRVPLDAILEGNIVKLKRRYPDGFSQERSLNRAE